MTITKNIKISITSAKTPKHNNVDVTFYFINEKKENEIELKLKLIDGKIIKSDLTSKKTDIMILNICSEFLEKLSVQEFNSKE